MFSNRNKDTLFLYLFSISTTFDTTSRDENGKTKFFNEIFNGKKKDADAYEAKKKSELISGVALQHSNITLDEYLDKWLEISAKPRLKERTYKDYVQYLKRYIRPKIGNLKLSKLKPLDIQAIYTWMLENELSPRTVRFAHAILSSALKQVVKWQIILISDCLSIYDQVSPLQQKCYAHHVRAIKHALETIPGGGSAYLEELKLLLQTAMALKTLQAELKATEMRGTIRHLEQWAANLLDLEKRNAPLAPEEEAVRQRLFKQRDHLFEFLKHKQVEATNNQAERQLRPAVIARKISCGNRTAKGAQTWQVLASLTVTSAQKNQSFKDLIRNAVYR